MSARRDLADYVLAALDSRWFVPLVTALTVAALVIPWWVR